MPIGFLAVAAGFSAVVMVLWNWLMPAIFGLGAIDFWQAFGILFLSRILFGSFGFKERKMKHNMMLFGHQMRKEWLKMTPEQRQEFLNKKRDFFKKRGFFEECTAENTETNHE